MKVAICYPPFTKEKRYPNLPQNRQFIYTASDQVKLYPVVMATAATGLKKLGHQILWLDAVTRRMEFKEFEKKLLAFDPDLLVLETKAPLMPKIWSYVNRLKKLDARRYFERSEEQGSVKNLTGSYPLNTVFVGDHVSFFPQESFENSKVDYVLTGGDYDFLLVNLVNHLTKREKLEPGIWHKENLNLKTQNQEPRVKNQNTGKFQLNHNLDQTPIIDRQLTRWRDYGEAYLYHPCAYIMFGRGCGIDKARNGGCTFCAWQQGLWDCSSRLRSPEQVVKEVKNLVDLGVKEIFDDTESGVLKDYHWMEEFYRLLKKEKILGKVIFSSNARGDQLSRKICFLLKKLNYRLLKVGLESGSNQTLKKINKKENVEDVCRGVKNAKDAGLRVMLTVMVGYPWESETEVKKTYQIARQLTLYKTKAGDCLQASVVTPYPGTLLWQQAKKNNWLLIKPDNYEKFDMSRSVLQSRIDTAYWCTKIWSIQKEAPFIIKSGLGIRSANDIKLLAGGAGSLLGHLRDYH